MSRALDAVLLPIDSQVRKAFKLEKKDRGVLVLSVEPGGTADKRGIMPGDVLSAIKGHKIKKPIDVDIRRLLLGQEGTRYDFPINYYRNGVDSHGEPASSHFDDYSTAIDIAGIGSAGRRWSFATAFSYCGILQRVFVRREFSASYESSESLIVGDRRSSEEFAAEIANESRRHRQGRHPGRRRP